MTEHQRFTVLLDARVRQAFDRMCFEAGTNASAVARGLIDAYVRRPEVLRLSDYTPVNMHAMSVPTEEKVRLTVLISPRLKEAFSAACSRDDMTPSQVIRRLINRWLSEQTEIASAARKAAKKPDRRR